MYEFLKFFNLNLPIKQPDMSLKSILPELLTDLYYPSESDEPIEVFSLEEKYALPMDEHTFRTATKLDEDKPVEALDVEQFWNNVTEVQDWYGEEQIAKAKKFEHLKNTLFENLENVHGYRVGEIEINVYLFGNNAADEVEGIKTMLVET